MINQDIWLEFIEMRNNQVPIKEIHETYMKKTGSTCTEETFARQLRDKRNKLTAAPEYKAKTIYPGQRLKAVTTQYNPEKDIVTQIWIKTVEEEYDVTDLLPYINKIKPVKFKQVKLPKTPYLLEVPLFDMHFGVNDFDWYQHAQQEILELLTSRKWEKIIFVIGQDLLHNNDFKGTTANGTVIEKIDLLEAYDNAFKFYSPLIETAIKYSTNVELIYSKGNHDETSAALFFKMLEKLFPQCDCDSSLHDKKVRVFHNNFIGWSHGDKGKKNVYTKIKDIRGVFATKFIKEYAATGCREIHFGHNHTERDGDAYGFMCRRLSTLTQTDEWSDDNDYIGNHKRFMLFEYDQHKLKHIDYIS